MATGCYPDWVYERELEDEDWVQERWGDDEDSCRQDQEQYEDDD